MRSPIDRRMTEKYSVGMRQARTIKTHRINRGPRAFSSVITIIIIER